MSVLDDIEALGKWTPATALRWSEDRHGRRVLQQRYINYAKDQNGNWTLFEEWRAIPVEYV